MLICLVNPILRTNGSILLLLLLWILGSISVGTRIYHIFSPLPPDLKYKTFLCFWLFWLLFSLLQSSNLYILNVYVHLSTINHLFWLWWERDISHQASCSAVFEGEYLGIMVSRRFLWMIQYTCVNDSVIVCVSDLVIVCVCVQCLCWIS